MPNSFPIKMNPKVKRIMFIERVSIDTGIGKKLLRTIAKAAILPTDTLLGIIKKNTANATIAVPIVIIIKSIILSYKDVISEKGLIYEIYVENYFNFEQCFVINPHFTIPLTKEGNLFKGELPVDKTSGENFDIIISDGVYQLPVTTYNKDFPYYCNGKWYEDRIDYSNIVYYSKNNEFKVPILCYEVNGKVIEQQMHINNDSIYYGYISKNA